MRPYTSIQNARERSGLVVHSALAAAASENMSVTTAAAVTTSPGSRG